MCWGGEGSGGPCGGHISTLVAGMARVGWGGGLGEEPMERDFCSLSGELPRFSCQKNK